MSFYLRFLSRAGYVSPKKLAIDAGPWLDLTASFGDRQSGLALLCHPSSVDFGAPWILRQKKSMQNLAYPGRTPRPLEKGKPWVFRYRIVIHEGVVKREAVDALFEDFSKLKEKK